MLARNRHAAQHTLNNSNSSIPSSPNSNSKLPGHINDNSPGKEHPNQHDNKYSKKASSLAARLQYWCWMTCGAICSFMSIDYGMRAVFPDSTTTVPTPTILSQHLSAASTTGATGFSMASARTSLMDGILNPTQSLFPPSSEAETYAFDNTAHIPADPQQHAILIPYRDRPFHLELFLEYMGPYLHTHFPHAHFTLWIIEQDDQELFNRAWLANVGLREIVSQAPQTSCVIFHDVDLVPNMTSHVPYTTCQWPVQLGSELEHFNWSVPYPAYCGGITTMSLKHWQLINGLGNGTSPCGCGS